MRTFRFNTIPPGAHPLVRELFMRMNDERIGLLDMAERSGVNKNTISGWRLRAAPDLVNLEACFGVLGYELTIKKKR